MRTVAKHIPIKWLPDPEKQDYPGAYSYLTLLFEDEEVQWMVKKLKKAPVLPFKSKDIFRASALALLPPENFHVHRDRQKIESGASLSPILLVRLPGLARVLIADGYHRMCAVYSFDEDAVIPCKIVTGPVP